MPTRPSLKSQAAALRALLKGGLKGPAEGLAQLHARAASETLAWFGRDRDVRELARDPCRLRFAPEKMVAVARNLAGEQRLDGRDAGNRREIAYDAIQVLEFLDENAAAIREHVAARKAARGTAA